MVFQGVEMATMYNQAADKKKQIQIFCETECMTEEEIRQILMENGIDGRKLPKEKKLPVPEETAERPVEDAVLDKIEAEEAEAEDAAVPVNVSAEPVAQKTMMDVLLDYIKGLQEERSRLRKKLDEVEARLLEINTQSAFLGPELYVDSGCMKGWKK